jgi:hypothetical protein
MTTCSGSRSGEARQHRGFHRQRAAAGGEERLLGADRLGHQLLSPGQVPAGGLAVIKAGRSQQVRAERILADRGTGPRVRAAALTMSRWGKPVPLQRVVVGQGIQDGRDRVIMAGNYRDTASLPYDRLGFRAAAVRRSENQLSGALAARRLLLFPAGMSRYSQPDARTRLFRGGGMRILRSLITCRDTGQVGALLDIKSESRWPLRFLGRRDRRRRGRLLSPVRTGLVLITHRSHPLRQDPGVPVDSRANPPALHSAASPRSRSRWRQLQ